MESVVVIPPFDAFFLERTKIMSGKENFLKPPFRMCKIIHIPCMLYLKHVAENL
jgi:hypothetical protein